MGEKSEGCLSLLTPDSTHLLLLIYFLLSLILPTSLLLMLLRLRYPQDLGSPFIGLMLVLGLLLQLGEAGEVVEVGVAY